MSQREDLTFIDLFAGIGGIRLAFEAIGGSCVMTSELDKWARQTYSAYFDEDEEDDHFNWDIKDLDPSEVPDHDVLTGGFPCQSFSIAGVSKKNALGRSHGFDDPTTGTLFFDIKEILLEKQPKAFLLENVKNLQSHDGGDTWKVIAACLHEAGYVFTSKVLDAADVVPQHRERVFIVGFHRDAFGVEEDRFLDWDAFWDDVDNRIGHFADEFRQTYGVPPEEKWPRVGPILESHEKVPDKYTLTENMWEYLQDYKRKHRAKGNGFGYGMVKRDDAYTRTLSARYYKDGSEALVYRGEDRRPRRLTPLECARLQGFPADFQRMYDRSEKGPEQPVSDTQAYKQFGNSVCVPIVTAISKSIRPLLEVPSDLTEFPDADVAVQEELFSDYDNETIVSAVSAG